MRKENSIKYICFWSDSAFPYYACTDAIQKLDFFKRDVHESLWFSLCTSFSIDDTFHLYMDVEKDAVQVVIM